MCVQYKRCFILIYYLVLWILHIWVYVYIKNGLDRLIKQNKKYFKNPFSSPSTIYDYSIHSNQSFYPTLFSLYTPILYCIELM